MSRSLKIRNDCLEQTKLALKRNGFPSQRVLAEESAMALSTISNFLRGKSVDYATFVEICQKLKLEWQMIADLGDRSSSAPLTVTAGTRQDWGEAIDVSIFYNRTDELATLKQWIMSDRCRLVSIMGMGGMGKTALSVKLAEHISSEFDYFIWRSLRNAPPLQEILATLLQFLDNRQEVNLTESMNKQSRLMAHLRTSRCLLILDNAESILQSGTSRYQPEYEEYGQFFKCVAETAHNSCLVLTSRESPPGVAALEGDTLPVRCLRLLGLSPVEGRKLFQAKRFFAGTDAQWSVLINHYAGNPLALKIVASAIIELFEGDVSRFLSVLAQGPFIFDEISELLAQQLGRLTPLEREMMYWLARQREPVSFGKLQANFAHSITTGELLQAIASLQRRSLIEKVTAGFTQQPVVMEYVSNLGRSLG